MKSSVKLFVFDKKIFFTSGVTLVFGLSLHAKFEAPEATLCRQARGLKTDTHSGKKTAPSIDTRIRVSIARTAQVIFKNDVFL